MLKEILFDSLYSNRSHRNYLGASILGHDCERAIWYSSRGTKEEIGPFSLLTFKIGCAVESLVLESLGDNIISPVESNNYLEVTCEEVPNLKGHLDGLFIRDGIHYV